MTCLMILASVLSSDPGYTCVPYHPSPVPVMPAVEDMPLAITSYWVWRTDGTMLHGPDTHNCNDDCSVTANGTRLPDNAADYHGGIAACPLPYVGRSLVIGGEVWMCQDTFGEPYRQAGPIWHSGYGAWVLPVDLLAPRRHGLVDSWRWK